MKEEVEEQEQEEEEGSTFFMLYSHCEERFACSVIPYV